MIFSPLGRVWPQAADPVSIGRILHRIPFQRLPLRLPGSAARRVRVRGNRRRLLWRDADLLPRNLQLLHKRDKVKYGGSRF